MRQRLWKLYHAELVAIDEFQRDEGYWASSGIVMDAEFKAYITEYLAGSPADIPVRSLAELVEFKALIESMRRLNRRYLIRTSLYRRWRPPCWTAMLIRAHSRP